MKPDASEPQVILLGSGSPALLGALGERFPLAVVRPRLERLPDGELRVAIGATLRGRAAYIVHTLATPVGERLLELGFMADAARRAGAEELVAVVPYLGYARQERRAHEDEALAAAVVARMVSTLGFCRIVTVDVHAPAIEGFFACPLDNVTAEPLLADALRAYADDAVVVAPDLGASKLARRYAARLGLPVAIVHKSRVGPREVVAHELVGEVRGRRPIIVDDLISTGATMVAALEAVVAAGAVPEAVVAATHGVFAPGSDVLFAEKRIRAVLTTDSVDATAPGRSAKRVALAPLLGEVITRLIDERALGELLASG